MKNNIHVTPHCHGGWQVKGAGNSRASFRTETQKEANKIGRNLAIKQQSELLIHNKEGRIRQKNSYGNDDFPPRG